MNLGFTHALNSLKEIAYYWQIVRYGGLEKLSGPKDDQMMLASLGITPFDDVDW